MITGESVSCQKPCNELQTVIDAILATSKRFEGTSMEGEMPEDYEKLLAILDDALKQQREHTRVMLDEDDASTGSA